MGHWLNGEPYRPQDATDLPAIWKAEDLWIAVYDNVITYSLTNSINPAIQVRQVCACPSNPLISTIEWVHSKTIQRKGHIVYIDNT